MNIRGPQLFYSFFHTLDESSSYRRTICGLELCFVVFVFSVSTSYIVCELLPKCVQLTSYVLLRRLIVNNERGPLICTLAENRFLYQSGPD